MLPGGVEFLLILFFVIFLFVFLGSFCVRSLYLHFSAFKQLLQLSGSNLASAAKHADFDSRLIAAVAIAFVVGDFPLIGRKWADIEQFPAEGIGANGCNRRSGEADIAHSLTLDLHVFIIEGYDISRNLITVVEGNVGKVRGRLLRRMVLQNDVADILCLESHHLTEIIAFPCDGMIFGDAEE